MIHPAKNGDDELRHLFLLLVLILVAQSSFGQATLSFYQLGRYESEKKDVGMAVVYSTVLPGGGLFYSGKIAHGFAFMGFEAVNALLILERVNKGEEYVTYFMTLSVLKIFEYFFAAKGVNDYNFELRRMISLSLSFGEGKPLQFKFSIPL